MMRSATISRFITNSLYDAPVIRRSGHRSWGEQAACRWSLRRAPRESQTVKPLRCMQRQGGMQWGSVRRTEGYQAIVLDVYNGTPAPISQLAIDVQYVSGQQLLATDNTCR